MGAKLLFLVTEDWYFWSHRLPVARAARDSGLEVVVATRVSGHGDAIRDEGFRLVPLGWSRRSLNPLREILALGEILSVYRRERPDIVHHVAIKPAVYGSVAARLAAVPAVVNAVAGLGYVFTGDDFRSRIIRPIMRLAFRLLLCSPRSRLILQNEDDRRALVDAGLAREGTTDVIRGSGVDIEHFSALPEPPDGPPSVAVVTRMLTFKGVADVVAASRLLRGRGVEHRLLLVGRPDPDSPAAIPEAQLVAWAHEPGIAWLGHRADVREVWAQAHVAVLASLGGEGLPKTLLEAAACGRPIVATDIPGCREIVRDGCNGRLVPPGDPVSLADALAELLTDAGMRARFGAMSRRMVESDLSAGAVGRRTVALYEALLKRVAAPGSTGEAIVP